MWPMPFSIAWRRCSVDARDQLRRYLEQRRELGETELVLDGMTVEETLRILGAQGAGGGGREAAGDSRRAAGVEREAPVSGDWREALRAAGAERPNSQAVKQPNARAIEQPSGPVAQQPSSPTAEQPSSPAAPIGITVSGTNRPTFGDPTTGCTTLDEIAARIATCTRC